MPYAIFDQATQLFAIAGCGFCALLLTGFFCWSLWNTVREGVRYLRRLHQVPCARCRYFTGEQVLKCTVHPCKAFSESAIDCLDFEPVSPIMVPASSFSRFDTPRRERSGILLSRDLI